MTYASKRMGKAYRTASLGCLVLCTLVGCRPGRGKVIYQQDDQTGFLIIKRMREDGVVSLSGQTRDTALGSKTLREVCRVQRLFEKISTLYGRPDRARQRYCQGSPVLSVIYDQMCLRLLPIESPDVGLELVRQPKSHRVFALRANTESADGLEPFKGQPKWPQLRTSQVIVIAEGNEYPPLPPELCKFPHGGVNYSEHDNNVLCFDGVSFDELFDSSERQQEV